MAKRTNRTEGTEGTVGAAQAPAVPSGLPGHAEGRAWLEGELEAARRELALGPGGGGWQYNEGLRPAIEQRVAFLEALIAKV